MEAEGAGKGGRRKRGNENEKENENENENEKENENENGGGERGKRKGGLQRKGNREACEDVNLDNPKLFSLVGAVARRETLRVAGKRVVLTNGVFDLLHTGHLFYLQQARALGDALLIALNADASVRTLKGPTRPIQSEEQRAYALAALACVDGVFIFGTPRLDAEIRALRPDIYTKAGDYTLEKLDAGERGALQSVGAEIKFMPFLAGFSTTALIARIKAAGEV
jgi:rfaE bifunctional protein nucleotidyltransferase chain/domain